MINELHQRLVAVLDDINEEYEILYVNDGSSDRTITIINEFAEKSANVAVVDLSRNFGKEIAVSAGLHHASGDAVVLIDADLQDPPELIPEMIDLWREGNDVVYAKRKHRYGESFFKRLTAKYFYQLIKRITKVKIPEDTGDFRLMSRRVVDAVNQLPECHRFMKGLFSWVGFKQVAIEYNRDPRFAGDTKWNYWRLWNLALEGITSFTTAPLKVASYFGILIALTGFIYAIYIIYKTIMYGDPVAGFPTLIVVVLTLGGIQLIGIGILGEYVSRIFDESKLRPLYYVQQFHPSSLSSSEMKNKHISELNKSLNIRQESSIGDEL